MNINDFENYIGTLSEDSELHKARYDEIKEDFVCLSDESKKKFLEILESGTIVPFKDYFREKDYNNMIRLYDGESIKGNFLYLTTIMDSISCRVSEQFRNDIVNKLKDS